MTDFLWLIIALPLAGAVVNHFVGRRLGEPRSGWLAVLGIGSAFVYGLIAAVPFFQGGEHAAEAVASVHLFDWIPGRDIILSRF